MSQFAGYILPGSVMLAFGLNWSFQLARPSQVYATISDRFSETSTGSRRQRRNNDQCCGKLRKLPIEGMVKLGVTGLGIAASVLAANPKGRFQFVGDILFATVYLFFALSGLIDVLVHYCSSAVPVGLEKFALGLAFIMEGLVFHLHLQREALMEQHVHFLLVCSIYACAAAALLEGVDPSSTMPRFARAHFTLLHGAWFIQSGFLLYDPSEPTGTSDPSWTSGEDYDSALVWISLLFAWHCAGAFVSVILLQFMCRWCCCKKKSEKKNRSVVFVPDMSMGTTGSHHSHHSHQRGGYCQRCLSHDEVRSQT